MRDRSDGSGPERVFRRPALGDVADRDALFAGDVLVGPPNDATIALIGRLREVVCAAFPGVDPRDARSVMTNDAWFRAWAGPRQTGGSSEAVRSLAEAVIASLGGERTEVVYDVPRLRAVTSDGHTVAEAAPAYRFHRDTWYGNPGAQINLWIPLWDVDEAASFAILPRFFGVAVANSSASFDVTEWSASGGFQAYAAPRPSGQIHPFPDEPPDRTGEWRIAAPAGGILAFSGAHLHGTVPQETGRIRYTMEIRLVDRRDLRDGRGAPDVDNASTGTTLGDFRAMRPR